MTENTWLTSTDPAAMFRHLYTNWLFSDRKLRLFAVACCRQVWNGTPCPGNRAGPCCQTPLCPVCHGRCAIGGITDPRSRRAVEVAELRADDLATAQQLRAAFLPTGEVTGKEWPAYWVAHHDALVAARHMFEREVVMITDTADQYPLPAIQASLIREIAGNPYQAHRYAWDAGKLWANYRTNAQSEIPLTADVLMLARRAYGAEKCPPCDGVGTVEYNEKRYDGKGVSYTHWGRCTGVPCAGIGFTPFDADAILVLRDALLDAGCTNEPLLRHLGGEEWTVLDYDETPPRVPVWGWRKSAVPHVRGCWALDLILRNMVGNPFQRR